jgi:hypothetical protein
MKAFTKIILWVGLITTCSVFAQDKTDSLGLPGDNFDLYGALELFKKSDTPEAFEKAINTNDNEINNLDLNADGKVDYVKVIANKEGDAHTLILQVAVTKSETQDVAVIEVEKTKEGNAHVQIVGDEELYGKDYIVEPKDKSAIASEKIKSDVETDDVYKGKDEKNGEKDNTNVSSNNNTNSNVVVNVWPWPAVQYIYSPAYVVWVSPWYWGYYPGWWNPWYPIYWRNHYWRAYRYHHHYHRAYYYRSPNVHKAYYGRRISSDVVRENQRSGRYAEKQISYKANVQPGKKYNAMPANPEKVKNNRNEGNSNQINQQPRNKNPRQEQNNTQPKQESKPVKIRNQQNNTQPTQKKQGVNMPQNNSPRQQGGSIKQGGGGGRNTGGGGGGGKRK